MKFHFKLISALILAFLFSLAVMKHVPAAGAFEPLSTAMEATGAQITEVSINAWVKLPNPQLTKNEMTSIVQQIMDQLQIGPQYYQLTSQQTPQATLVQAESVSPSFHAKATIDQKIGQQAEAYLVITIETKVEADFINNHIQELMTDIIKKIPAPLHINTCLIGGLDGKLMDGENQKILQKAFIAINATIIDKIETEQFVSYTGFTPEIAEWSQVVDKKINFNMAIRYSQYDDRTYIIIGSPVITCEY